MTALEALLSHIVDYAGLYPPAALSLEETCANYAKYLTSRESWMLNRLVLPAAKLRLGEGWRISLIVDDEPGSQPPQVETFETKAPRRLSLPTYCEVPIAQLEDGFGKIRTADIGTGTLVDFLLAAAARRIPFKATAGLHHPLRSATMHGFLNVFVAAAFAWNGTDRAMLVDVVEDGDVRSFEFTADAVRWRGHALTTSNVEAVRRVFAHSFGSCSFEEPIADLRGLGLLS